MINDKKKYKRLKFQCKKIDQSPDIIDDLGCINIFEFYTIIIINKYLIDELLKEKDYDLLFCLIVCKRYVIFFFIVFI